MLLRLLMGTPMTGSGSRGCHSRKVRCPTCTRNDDAKASLGCLAGVGHHSVWRAMGRNHSHFTSHTQFPKDGLRSFHHGQIACAPHDDAYNLFMHEDTARLAGPPCRDSLNLEVVNPLFQFGGQLVILRRDRLVQLFLQFLDCDFLLFRRTRRNLRFFCSNSPSFHFQIHAGLIMTCWLQRMGQPNLTATATASDDLESMFSSRMPSVTVSCA